MFRSRWGGIYQPGSRSRGRGQGISQIAPLPKQGGTSGNSTSAQLVNIIIRVYTAGTHVWDDIYVVTATAATHANTDDYGLLPSQFRLELFRVTSWPVTVSEPIIEQFKDPEYNRYIS